MRAIGFICIIISFQAAAQKPFTTPDALIKSWEAFWNTYDLREVPQLFVNDSTVTYFSSERAGLIKGIDNLVKHHEGFGFLTGGKKSENKLWLSDVHYFPSAVIATWHFQRPGADEQRGPVTFVLKKDKSGYKIQHAHFSNDPKK